MMETDDPPLPPPETAESPEPPIPPEPPAPERTPYTFWQTIGLFLLIMAGQLVLGGVIVGLMILHSGQTSGPGLVEFANGLKRNGLLVALSTLVANPLLVALMVVLVNARGYAAREYFALMPVRARAVVFWLAMVIVFAYANGFVNHLTGHAEVSSFMLDTYRSCPLALLVPALILAAPVFEELFFRGLLFLGFTRRGWGQGGAGTAILLTAALFAILHVQYDAQDIISIFALGLLLGLARQLTGSTWTTIAMHALTNLLGTVEVALLVHRG